MRVAGELVTVDARTSVSAPRAPVLGKVSSAPVDTTTRPLGVERIRSLFDLVACDSPRTNATSVAETLTLEDCAHLSEVDRVGAIVDHTRDRPMYRTIAQADNRADYTRFSRATRVLCDVAKRAGVKPVSATVSTDL